MILTIFYDVVAGASLAAAAYVAWSEQWAALPFYSALAWVALWLWFSHQEEEEEA